MRPFMDQISLDSREYKINPIANHFIQYVFMGLTYPNLLFQDEMYWPKIKGILYWKVYIRRPAILHDQPLYKKYVANKCHTNTVFR